MLRFPLHLWVPRITKTIIKPKENEGNATVFTAFVDNKKCKTIINP